MAASNTKQGDIIMKILIEERLEQIGSTLEIILAAVNDKTRGKAILHHLLGVVAQKNNEDTLRILLRIIRSKPYGLRDALFQVIYRG